jgi:hypothetical protein
VGDALHTDVRLAPLRYLIGHVVSVSAEEKMIWVHTRWIVTAMQNQHSRGNFTAMNLVRETMRATHSVVEPECAIPFDVLGTRPIPAPVSLLNLAPKAVHAISNANQVILTCFGFADSKDRTYSHLAGFTNEIDLAD